MKSITFIALSIAFISTVRASDYSDLTEEQQYWINYSLSLMQGFSKGYYKEFYHNLDDFESSCFGTESKEQITEVIYFLSFGELKDIMPTYNNIKTLTYDNFYNCGYYETIIDLTQVCTAEGACTFSWFTNNLTKNIFKIIQVLNDVMDLSVHFHPL